MNYRKDEYIRAHNPFPRQPDVGMRLGVCANTRAPRVIGIVQFTDVNGPKRKLVKSGKGKNARLIRRVVFK